MHPFRCRLRSVLLPNCDGEVLRCLHSDREGKNITVQEAKSSKRILPLWIEVWLVMSAIICFVDVLFTMLRPHTTEGILSGVFLGWNLYASVDVRYADETDIVTCGTGRVMLVEIIMNLVAVVMSRRRSRHTLLTAFTTSAFVFWKTLWFLTLYVMPPPGNRSYFTESSSYLDILLIFWIPN
ncbi:hypothetical protein COOONC_12432, partial [Cooperia oncophora]